ncbi:MAG: hypothetical protein QM754_21315 [Tepidisphaeraceae bacterium]
MSQLPDHLLNAFADGELSPAEMARVAAILQADAGLTEEVRTIQEIGDALRAAPLPTPAAGLSERLMNNWRVERDRSVRRLAGWMTAAAAIVLGITVANNFTRTAVAQPVLAEWETAAVSSTADDDDTRRTAKLLAVDLALPSPEARR